MDNVLHVVCTTDDGTYFCKLFPQEGQGLVAGTEPTVHLDRRIEGQRHRSLQSLVRSLPATTAPRIGPPSPCPTPL